MSFTFYIITENFHESDNLIISLIVTVNVLMEEIEFEFNN